MVADRQLGLRERRDVGVKLGGRPTLHIGYSGMHAAVGGAGPSLAVKRA